MTPQIGNLFFRPFCQDNQNVLKMDNKGRHNRRMKIGFTEGMET
jgi:hypothetical protein